MHTITLTEDEAKPGIYCGIRRQLSSVAKGSKETRPTECPWERHIEGALYEVAVAKFLGVRFLATVDTYKAADLGDVLQVRGTAWPNGHLLLHEDDPEGHYYIFVTGRYPEYKIIGWCHRSYPKPTHWNDKMQAYAVEQRELTPIEALPKEALRGTTLIATPVSNAGTAAPAPSAPSPRPNGPTGCADAPSES